MFYFFLQGFLVSCSSNTISDTMFNLKCHQWNDDDANNVQSGPKSHEFDYCGKLFPYKSTLEIHRRIHTGERPYRCDICMANFSLKINLTKHERTHTGERPYIWNLCDKAFSDRGNLKQHQRTHTGEKPYKWEFCDIAFSKSSRLKRHQMTHTGDMPFKCDVCDKAFSQKSNLKTHQRTHTVLERSLISVNFVNMLVQIQVTEEHIQEKRLMNLMYVIKNLPIQVIWKLTNRSVQEKSLTHVTYVLQRFKSSNLNCGKFIAKRQLKVHKRTHAEEKP